MMNRYNGTAHFRKVAWLFGLAVLVTVGCAKKNECDFTSDFIIQADGSSPILFHNTTARAKIAQKFVPSGSFDLGDVAITIRKTEASDGALVGVLSMAVHKEDAGRPDNDPISGGGPKDIDISNISKDSLTEVTVSFSDEPGLNAGVTYYLVIDFTGEVDGTNYFQLGATSVGTAYPDGEVWLFDSLEDDEDLAWTISETEDLEFTIGKCEASN